MNQVIKTPVTGTAGHQRIGSEAQIKLTKHAEAYGC